MSSVLWSGEGHGPGRSGDHLGAVLPGLGGTGGVRWGLGGVGAAVGV